MASVKQVWVQYTLWEDFKAGMWRRVTPEEHKLLLPIAVDFMANSVMYGKAMSEVLVAWPNTMLNGLTNSSINRKAFLGHCACCYKIQMPESVTRAAWWMLTEQQRVDADEQAMINIESWITLYQNRFQYKIPFP